MSASTDLVARRAVSTLSAEYVEPLAPGTDCSVPRPYRARDLSDRQIQALATLYGQDAACHAFRDRAAARTKAAAQPRHGAAPFTPDQFATMVTEAIDTMVEARVAAIEAHFTRRLAEAESRLAIIESGKALG